VAGEPLHLEPGPEGGFSGLAGLPVDVRGEVEAEFTLGYTDGSSETVRVTIPVGTTPFDHEELTVAPRYGSPPSEEDRARRAADVAKARSVSETAHQTPRLWDRRVVQPRDDRVTSGFGNGRVFNGQVSSRHMGLDLDGETGDTVYAAARGVVALTDAFQLAGNIVYLNHGAGLVSGYFHLSEQLVSPGDTVFAGTPIGRVGATGRVTGPHLHWVVRYGHTSVDPRSLLEVLPAMDVPPGG
jgi:murein DD-endopeptidase MepM/ murein hydrolase activator NlpD